MIHERGISQDMREGGENCDERKREAGTNKTADLADFLIEVHSALAGAGSGCGPGHLVLTDTRIRPEHK